MVEVAAGCVTCRHQAQRTAVAAYLDGAQRLTREKHKCKDADRVKDNLGEFGFPGLSLKVGDLTGALSQGHDDTVETEMRFFGCGATLLLSNPAKHSQKKITVS